MAEVQFSESAYRFSDPIRVFKANDPYYYEVDNIPIRQLQENCLWLKDQLTGGPIEIKNIARKEFADLKPSISEEAERKITVNPGRYTARINDAYNIQPLASLYRMLEAAQGYTTSEEDPVLHKWRLVRRDQSTTETGDGLERLGPKELNDILQDWQDNVSGELSLGMNGLAERAFAFPTKSVYESTVASYSASGEAPNLGVAANWTGYDDVPFPIFEALLWAKHTGTNGYGEINLFDYDTEGGLGFTFLPVLENQLIRRWRGVARTAVVDVPNPISIQIPPFMSDEFFYVNDETKTEMSANTRIDLLFIYSKPVDVAETTIIKPKSGAADAKKTITKPELGLVKGAGIGIDSSLISPANDSDVPGRSAPIEAYDEAGNLLMLPDPRAIDETAADGSRVNGFDNVTQAEVGEVQHGAYGSFPVPDDLLNLAPALLESLEGTEWDLVGQSILPIAYIVSRKGTNALEERDIIDIRPFFRTTELTYNERSGIAAAYPPLSLANPAVGRRDLDRVETGIRRKINDMSPALQEQLDSALALLPIPKPRLTARLEGVDSAAVERRLAIQDVVIRNNRPDIAQGYEQNTDCFTLIESTDQPMFPNTGTLDVQVNLGGIYQIKVNVAGQPRAINTGDTLRLFYLNIVNENNVSFGTDFTYNTGTEDEPVETENPYYIYPTQSVLDSATWAWGHPLTQRVGTDSSDFEIAGSFHFSRFVELQSGQKLGIYIKASGAPDRVVFFQGSLELIRISNPNGGEGQLDPDQ